MHIQALTFICILLAGFVYVALLGLFGGHGHDHDASGGHGGHHGPGDHPAEHTPTVSLFSPRIIALFMVGFGAAGFLATHQGKGLLFSTASAVLGGVVLGFIAWGMLTLLYSQQSDSTVQSSTVVGTTATVSTEIPADGMGEVNATVSGQVVQYWARATGGEPLPVGAQVRILSIAGSTVEVEPILGRPATPSPV